MKYDKSKPLVTFIKQFNSMVDSMDTFEEKYSSLVNNIDFITEQVLPRFEGKPAIFKSEEDMTNSDVLAEGDICMVFKRGSINGELVQVFRVEKLTDNNSSKEHVKLRDTTIGAFPVSTVEMASTLLAKINEVKSEVDKKLSPTDSADKLKSNFTKATTRTNFLTGETVGVILGKVNKYLEDLKTIAFTGNASDITESTTKRFVTDTEKSKWNAKEDSANKGKANGYASLDSTGKVPSGQLPSYVDDVLEYSSITNFPATGETGKIYVATTTNITYRWSGSGYVEISQSLALGETSSTAYRGDRGKVAYDHTSNKNNPHGVTKSQVGLSNVDNVKQMPINGGDFTGIAKAMSNTSYSLAQLHNTVILPKGTTTTSIKNGGYPNATIIYVLGDEV